MADKPKQPIGGLFDKKIDLAPKARNLVANAQAAGKNLADYIHEHVFVKGIQIAVQKGQATEDFFKVMHYEAIDLINHLEHLEFTQQGREDLRTLANEIDKKSREGLHSLEKRTQDFKNIYEELKKKGEGLFLRFEEEKLIHDTKSLINKMKELNEKGIWPFNDKELGERINKFLQDARAKKTTTNEKQDFAAELDKLRRLPESRGREEMKDALHNLEAQWNRIFIQVKRALTPEENKKQIDYDQGDFIQREMKGILTQIKNKAEQNVWPFNDNELSKRVKEFHERVEDKRLLAFKEQQEFAKTLNEIMDKIKDKAPQKLNEYVKALDNQVKEMRVSIDKLITPKSPKSKL